MLVWKPSIFQLRHVNDEVTKLSEFTKLLKSSKAPVKLTGLSGLGSLKNDSLVQLVV